MRSLTYLIFCVLSFHFAHAAKIVLPSGAEAEEIGVYDLPRLEKILTTELAEFSDFEVEFAKPLYPVKLYRVTYRSVIPEQQNRPTIASGLVAIPQLKEKTLPVVSYQHGTVFSKTTVPSNPEESSETRLMVANFAGQGYVVIAPDYFGKGSSPETDSYLVKASTQQACLDHLYTAFALCEVLGIEPGPLFVSGWSQGGWATLAFLNKLESVGIPVSAAGAASGPTDVFATINGWIFAPRELDASYIPAALALQIHAMENYHSLPGLAAAAIRPEYLETARDLYLNNISYSDAYAKLPSTSKELFQEEFLNPFSAQSVRYWDTLNQSTSHRWRAVTPIRTYYGQIDEVTSLYIGHLAADFQKAVGGAQAEALDAGEKANHRGVFLFGIADQQKWFAERLKAPTPTKAEATPSPTAQPKAAATPKDGKAAVVP